MPTPTQVLQQEVSDLKEQVKTLSEKVGSLFVKKDTDRNIAVAAPSEEISEKVLNELGLSDPVPLEYKQKVDAKLNSYFKVHQKGTSGGFMFTVIVPDKYSTLTPDQKAMNVMDIRPKVIDYALGILGVEEWLDTVYKTFNPEIQALITADRFRGV